MKSLEMKPEEILFTKFDGTPDLFYEVVWDELDCPENYKNRIPSLIDLMAHGEPYHRLLACIMLTSWGNTAGFQTLIEWATYPDKTPWQGEAVLHDPITDADSAFEKLAEAIGTSYNGLESQEISSLRESAVKALLKLFSTVFFDSTLSFAICRGKYELLPNIIEDIYAAIDKSFEVFDRQDKPKINLQMQVASLLGTLEGFDEPTIVNYAKKLVKNFPDDRQTLFELVLVLGGCKNTEALALLEDLYQKNTGLEEHILKAIARFKNKEV
ncbi:MAG: hypothetical protein HC852_17815 [Acaryochloridaceae cyanobacterium RU_4_10]|nr:hypothetical protein [Acaryochloridaceae cyanobacterium RU_4_10]